MVSMADEFKIDWAKAIEDAAIDYADTYVELQCDADNDHQREHREALRDLRETIRRGLECAAAPQPAAQPTSDLANAFYEHIKHGNDAHQAWLKEHTLGWFAKHVTQPAAQPLKSWTDFLAGYNAGMDDAKRMARMDLAQPAAQPELTDAEILDLAENCTAQYHDLLSFAHAVIAAHEAKKGGAA